MGTPARTAGSCTEQEHNVQTLECIRAIVFKTLVVLVFEQVARFVKPKPLVVRQTEAGTQLAVEASIELQVAAGASIVFEGPSSHEACASLVAIFCEEAIKRFRQQFVVGCDPRCFRCDPLDATEPLKNDGASYAFVQA